MDDFPDQLRKVFTLDIVIEAPAYVAAIYENERDHAADIIEEQLKRIEQLEKRLKNFLTLPMYNKGCGCGFCISVDAARAVIGDRHGPHE
jgi:hypothetical protein